MTSKIEWCSHTSNCVTGCLGPHGVPCSYCYALRFRKRLVGVPGTIQAALKRAGLDINTPAFDLGALNALELDLRSARKPRRIFIASMGDLGYDGDYVEVKNSRVARTNVSPTIVRGHLRILIRDNPRHTFLLLSKQPQGLLDGDWPYNAHVGVSLSTSHPHERDRVWTLMGVKAGVRWASVEPLLDEDFDTISSLRDLDWVVVGAQTGPGAKMSWGILDAAKRIVRWCDLNAIPVFVKSNMRKADPDFAWPQEYPR